MKQRMLKAYIRLSSLGEVEEFVEVASKCDFDINVCKKQYRIMVDGKSILGMIGTLGTEVLEVAYNGENQEFLAIIEKFAAI